MVDDAGTPFLLDLADVALLEDGDGLALERGGIIVVLSAAEPVADIECRDAIHAAKIAWHIGNRHTALQVLGEGRLRIADDHVLVDMVEGLGARVLRHEAAFQPEPGAYVKDEGETHGHDHG
jgi:urease accessory protein